jgi:hypothetical protein
VTVNTASTTAAAGKEKRIALWMSVSVRQNSERLPAERKTKMKGEKRMSIQLYNIHLINGEVLQVGEDYHLKGPKTIVNRFTKANDDEILDFESAFTSMYVPRKNILFIATADVIA